MKIIFEQFGFIKPMINNNSPRVQECAFWGMVGTAVSYISQAFTYMADNVLGISLVFLTALFVIMVVDFVTGLRSSLKKGEKRSSKKGLRWVVKFGVYFFVLYISNALVIDSLRLDISFIPVTLEIMKYFLLLFICYWEVQSIDENLEKLGYSFRILKVFQGFYLLFISVTNKAIKEKTGIDNAIKEEDIKSDNQNK